MGRGKLTKQEQEILEKNPFVTNVSQNRITYATEFKLRFMEEYMDGKRPTAIFRGAGFDPKILGSKRIERACARWKESYQAGSLGSYDQQRRGS